MGRLIHKFTIHNENSDKPIFDGYQLPKFFGCRIAVHVFYGADAVGCFHDHPAHAFRVILWGGYAEEIRYSDGTTRMKRWFPCMMGRIAPEFEHRIDHLFGKRSIGLWMRGPMISTINTRGC